MAMQSARDSEVSPNGDGHGQTTPAEVEFRVGLVYEDRGVRIRPIGEVDLGTIGLLRERTNEAMASGADRVILDLRATTFFGTNGLHLAVDIDSWATRNGIEFAIIPGPRIVQHAFDAVGLTARLPFVDGTHLR